MLPLQFFWYLVLIAGVCIAEKVTDSLNPPGDLSFYSAPFEKKSESVKTDAKTHPHSFDIDSFVVKQPTSSPETDSSSVVTTKNNPLRVFEFDVDSILKSNKAQPKSAASSIVPKRNQPISRRPQDSLYANNKLVPRKQITPANFNVRSAKQSLVRETPAFESLPLKTEVVPLIYKAKDLKSGATASRANLGTNDALPFDFDTASFKTVKTDGSSYNVVPQQYYAPSVSPTKATVVPAQIDATLVQPISTVTRAPILPNKYDAILAKYNVEKQKYASVLDKSYNVPLTNSKIYTPAVEYRPRPSSSIKYDSNLPELKVAPLKYDIAASKPIVIPVNYNLQPNYNVAASSPPLPKRDDLVPVQFNPRQSSIKYESNLPELKALPLKYDIAASKPIVIPVNYNLQPNYNIAPSSEPKNYDVETGKVAESKVSSSPVIYDGGLSRYKTALKRPSALGLEIASSLPDHVASASHHSGGGNVYFF